MVRFFQAPEDALADIQDGAAIMVGGFGPAGQPTALIDALIACRARGLTLISNNAGNGTTGLAALLLGGQVERVICSYPRQDDSWVIEDLHRTGRVTLEVVPQGTLAERIRAGGAGIGGFYTPTAVGTLLAEGKETREIDGRQYVLELPLHADFALIAASVADGRGNLVYRKTARNFGPLMATAATTTVVQVRQVLRDGFLDPEAVVTPGIFVDRVVEVPAGPDGVT